MDTLDRTAGAIRGRAARVVHIINAEMENYEPGVYTERVLESIKLLSETGECTVLYTKRVWHKELHFNCIASHQIDLHSSFHSGLSLHQTLCYMVFGKWGYCPEQLCLSLSLPFSFSVSLPVSLFLTNTHKHKHNFLSLTAD